MRQWWVMALLGSSACANVVPGDHYTLYLDPNFSDGEKAYLVDSLQDWTSKVPVSLDVVIQACDGFNNGVICTHRSDASGVASHHGESSFLGVTETVEGDGRRGDSGGKQGLDGGEMWLDMSLIYSMIGQYPTALAQTFNHEMGHAMGLQHHSTHALMYPGIDGASPTVTCDDVAQWYYVRFRTVPTCTIPVNQ